MEYGVCWVDVINNKNGDEVFVYKFNVFYFIVDDWVVDNYVLVDFLKVENGYYVGWDVVNIYGDEYDFVFDFIQVLFWLIRGMIIFYCNGYCESDLLNYDIENIKVNVVFYLCIKFLEGVSFLELIWVNNFSQGSMIF